MSETFTVYRLRSKGAYYVGSTSNMTMRLGCHRYRIRKGIGSLSESNFDINFKVDILEICSTKNRYDRENYWIDNSEGICLNRSRASIGPIGHKRPDHCIKQAGNAMRARWKRDRKKMLLRVNAHKTRKYQSEVGKLGAMAAISKLPPIEVFNRDTKVLIGKFQTAKECAAKLGYTIDQVNKRKVGLTIDNRLIFKYEMRA